MPDIQKLITMSRVNESGQYEIYYPKTVAQQVFIVGAAAGADQTLADHVANTNIHLSSEERAAMNNINTANGFVKLGADGFVPAANINPAILAITTEFANITALLAATTTQVAEGQLVMVTDASGDSTVGSGWAIYRRKAGTTTLNALTAWQKIAESESIDVVTSWASITGKPSSAVGDIDDAVTKRHTHSNKTTLDALTDASTTGANAETILMYGTEKVAFQSTISHFKVVNGTSNIPDASSLQTNDFVFVVTETLS